MSLVCIRNLDLDFGGPPVFDNLNLTIENRERICLVGRNGSGKSTLIKLLAGFIDAADGHVERRTGYRVALMPQDLPGPLPGRVFDIVAAGRAESGALLKEFNTLSRKAEDSPHHVRDLQRVQQALETAGGWELKQHVDTVLSRLSLDAGASFDSLSGGTQRRVLLARALVNKPDLLLLDEPTNHLDLPTIEWLEEFLLQYAGSLLFVSHDRKFISRLATRIIELDRGRLTSWPGDYQAYLAGKQETLRIEEEQQAGFDRKLGREEIWIRQGIKARRTRNEGRVRALKQLRKERMARRSRSGNVRLHAQQAESSGELVIESDQVDYGYGNTPLISNFSTTITRGDKIGIIGPNGVGKTSLIRLLLGELSPQKGHIRHGTRLKIGYFDQQRSQLDADRSVLDNLADGRLSVEINGQPRHVISYLQDFLFTPDRARQPVSALSGGEKNRLMLARMFSQPTNLLVLDEPTNDLDMETLDLLEEQLVNYPGSILLVSHDRAFLDAVVTGTLVFQGDGVVAEYIGGYEDWLRQRPAPVQTPARVRSQPDAKPAGRDRAKLGYKQQRELEQLPARIESLEEQQARLQQEFSDPSFYQQPESDVAGKKRQLDQVSSELETLYARWEELEQY